MYDHGRNSYDVIKKETLTSCVIAGDYVWGLEAGVMKEKAFIL